MSALGHRCISELEEALVSIVAGVDIHRKQLTFDYVVQETGRWERGRIVPADRQHLADWLVRFDGVEDVQFAMEGCTGWRYVAEEMRAAGLVAQLAEPADTAALRRRRRRAKTDLLTELADRPLGWCVPGGSALARFAARDQRRGRAAELVSAGGAAGRVA
jgi:hypothetical protein